MKRKGIGRMVIGFLVIVFGIVWLIVNKSEEVVLEDIVPVSQDGEYCYGRIQVATNDAPYNVEEHIKILINGIEVSGTKKGTQNGPDMTNGYEGELKGTKEGDNMELVYSYVVEGSANKELELYNFFTNELQKKRYVLKEENGMLVPDKTNPPSIILYPSETCYN
ncbi:MAG: hypothetical protein KBD52_00945 [Candidatus Pacebacteria bacterium]|nr:hypothetical protein [Candidatus Paceibacterota bacterium]